MRIKFTKEVAVDLNEIPNTAWGRIQKKPHSSKPVIDPETDLFVTPVGSEMGHVFPVGAVVTLPDELADKYLADGSAEEYVGPQGHEVKHDRNAPLNSVAHMEAIN